MDTLESEDYPIDASDFSAVISLARSTVSFSLGGNVSGAIARAPSSVRGRFLVPDSSTHLVTSDPSNRARLEGLLGPALVAAPNLSQVSSIRGRNLLETAALLGSEESVDHRVNILTLVQSDGTKCLLLLGLGSELGAGFRAGGRAVNLGCKRLLSKEQIQTCRALSKRGRPKTVVCRETMLPAHALLKQASSQGVIATRADFRVHVPRSARACGQCGARGVDTVGPDASQNARVSQGRGVSHLTSSVTSTGQPVGVRMCSGNADRMLFRGHRARSPSRDAG